MQKLTREEIEQRIIDDYQKVTEVVYIYTCIAGRELRVLVLTSNKVHDNELMDRVLTVEYALHNLQLVDSTLLAVTYLPLIFNPNIPSSYKLIYTKEEQ